jgi:protein-S-isoprenylcysteine O-methyltransferase Ste14
MLNVLSSGCLLLFGSVYIAKLLLLKYSDKILANSLGNKGKERNLSRVERLVKWSVYTWIAIWILNIFGFSIYAPLLLNIPLRYIGVAMNALGSILFFVSVIVMDKSWRVGIDQRSTAKLVTNGIYSFSRNPAYLAFDMMFLGVAITFGDIGLALFGMIAGFSLHKLILKEELHLEKKFKKDYINYKNAVGRYF